MLAKCFPSFFARLAHVSVNLEMLLNKLLNECVLMLMLIGFISQGLWPVTVSFWKCLFKLACKNLYKSTGIVQPGLWPSEMSSFSLSLHFSVSFSLSHEEFTAFSTFLLSLLVSCFTLSTCLISLLWYVTIICCIWVDSVVVNHSYKPIIVWPLQLFIFSRKHLFKQRNLIYSCLWKFCQNINYNSVFSRDPVKFNKLTVLAQIWMSHDAWDPELFRLFNCAFHWRIGFYRNSLKVPVIQVKIPP